MSKPEIAAREPQVMELEPGEYWWCACGRSKDGVFCDGSHEGTGITPQSFTVTERQSVALCQCKQTKNPPFCDGSHAEL
ncbi:MAG: CDGSH iron-sulfur domain-containing protein [Mariprofundaceae bacterium]